MSTPKKVVIFDKDSPIAPGISPYPISFEANGTKIFIAIDEFINTNSTVSPGVTSANGSTSPFKQFGYIINRANSSLTVSVTPAPISPQDVIIQKLGPGDDNNHAIYQFSLDFTNFIKGANTISLFEMFPNNTPPVNNLIGTIEFFMKEDNNEVNVTLQRPGIEKSGDEVLWDEIYRHYLSFKDYETFIDTILCTEDKTVGSNRPTGFFNAARRLEAKTRSPFIRSDEYNLIKFATDFYMLAKFGLNTTLLKDYLKNGKLPYYDIVVDRVRDDKTVARFLGPDFNPDTFSSENDCEIRGFERIFNPIMIELIWSYWMEMGMLVQTMNVINLRFQNIKGSNYRDPLTRFDTDPLRPLSHILWGYIQDEQHRLSLPRRLNEYDHEYGLTLTGRAVPRISPVDSRVRFLEAFHSLLAQCLIYFHESDDTTRIADAFPILNSLKEVHLLLAEGNHNAYGNLTWTARQEMMMQQYILSRAEMREFLGGRVMVPYPETWMDRVDTMRNIQGWGGSGIVNFYELAVHGELILLSIRYGNWSDVTLDRNNAANWAQRFRNSIQRYIHAYRSVTGVDLSVDQIIQLPNHFATQPTFLIQQRMLQEATRKRA